MTIRQNDIFGNSNMNESPVIVANKFFAEWEEQLQSVNYNESNLFQWFSKWFVIKYGATEESIEWLLISRIRRTLQDIAFKKRKHSGI